jgi:hypothetical protein
MSRAARNDAGLMSALTLGKLAVVLGIIGVFGYDGFSVMSNNVSTESQAQDAAYAASQAWHDNNRNLTLAYQAAVASLADTGDTVLQQGFSVEPDGTIHLLVRHTAKTVIFNHIGPLKHLIVTTQHGDANSVN